MPGIGSFLSQIGSNLAPQFAQRKPMATPPFVPGQPIPTPEAETDPMGMPPPAPRPVPSAASQLGGSAGPPPTGPPPAASSAPDPKTYRPDLDADQQRLMQVAREGAPLHPQHGKARSIGEALTSGFLGQPMAETIWDHGYQQQKQDYAQRLQNAARPAEIRAKAEKGAADVSHTMAASAVAGKQAENADAALLIGAAEHGADVSGAPINVNGRQIRFTPKPQLKDLPQTIATYRAAGYSEEEAKILAGGGKPGDFTKPPEIRNLEGLVARIVADPQMSPEAKKAKLEEARNAHNLLNPDKPVIHWTEGKDGTVRAVTANPAAVQAGGGMQSYGQIGKPQQPPASLIQREASADALERVAQGIALNGDLTNIKDIAGLRNDQRLMLYDRIRQLNPSMSQSELQRQIKAEDYWTNGKGADQLQSFGQFLEHAGAARDAMELLKSTDVKLLNRPLNWIRDHATSPELRRVHAALEPVKKEFEKFLLNNQALYAEDRASADKILSADLPLADFFAAVEQMGHIVQARYNEGDNRYFNTRKKHLQESYPMSDEAMEAAKKIGVDLSGSARTRRVAGGGGPATASPAIVQKNRSTGQFRHSLDGGQTWLPGQPQNQ